MSPYHNRFKKVVMLIRTLVSTLEHDNFGYWTTENITNPRHFLKFLVCRQQILKRLKQQFSFFRHFLQLISQSNSNSNCKLSRNVLLLPPCIISRNHTSSQILSSGVRFCWDNKTTKYSFSLVWMRVADFWASARRLSWTLDRPILAPWFNPCKADKG